MTQSKQETIRNDNFVNTELNLVDMLFYGCGRFTASASKHAPSHNNQHMGV